MTGVKGRVALVTGAGRGIGRVTADMLASRGARVMAVSRSENELQTLGLDYVAADLGTLDGCVHAVEETQDRLGPVEVLVCNHGIGSAHERVIWEQEPEVWRETMRINLDGPYYLSQAIIKDMVEKGFGRLIYISSTAGQVAEFAGSAYTSSKHGLLGLMRAVAQDAGPHGVTSNAVLPGWVRTPMAEKSAKAEAEECGITVDEVWVKRAALYPPGRVVTPGEVAEMIAFLASEESSGVNGEAITVALGSVY
ncbi:MAG: SDR family oxidoreductase [bacterium]|nr:SDR family oxidoreductase [bacterium]